MRPPATPRPRRPGRPLVSIVTPTLNAAASLGRTIDSVQAQTYDPIEHIVVDGGSDDGTGELLRRRLRQGDFWISARDRGISDAFNRGLALGHGDLVLFLNADDWLSEDQIEVAVGVLRATPEADFVFGDLLFYRNGLPEFRLLGEPDYARSIHRRMPALNHPTVLARRRAFVRAGLFDLRYRCAMEYDWFLRLHRLGARGVHDRRILGHMNHDGVSNAQFVRTMREVEHIAVAHGRPGAIARLETAFRIAKIATGNKVREHAQPLYRAVRRGINRSYRPVDDAGTRGRGRMRRSESARM